MADPLSTARVRAPWRGGQVLLSFDDGPQRDVTEELLEVLRALDVRASFMLTTTQLDGHLDLVAAMLADGHAVGPHGHEHLDMARLGEDDALGQLERSHSALLELGASPRWWRAPYGRSTTATRARARELGMDELLWSVEGRDWLAQSPQDVAATVLEVVGPGDTVLLHDGRKPHLRTAEVVDELVRGLRGRGVEVGTEGLG